MSSNNQQHRRKISPLKLGCAIVLISLLAVFIYWVFRHFAGSYSEAKATSSAFLKSFTAGDLKAAVAYTDPAAISEEELGLVYKKAQLLKNGEYQVFDAADMNSFSRGTVRIKGFIADSHNPNDIRSVYIRCK